MTKTDVQSFASLQEYKEYYYPSATEKEIARELPPEEYAKWVSRQAAKETKNAFASRSNSIGY